MPAKVKMNTKQKLAIACGTIAVPSALIAPLFAAAWAPTLTARIICIVWAFIDLYGVTVVLLCHGDGGYLRAFEALQKEGRITVDEMEKRRQETWLVKLGTKSPNL